MSMPVNEYFMGALMTFLWFFFREYGWGSVKIWWFWYIIGDGILISSCQPTVLNDLYGSFHFFAFISFSMYIKFFIVRTE